MKDISERLDEIAKERNQLHSTQTVQERTSGVTEYCETISAQPQQVYGRKKQVSMNDKSNGSKSFQITCLALLKTFIKKFKN